jgi:formiminotetrahydrofolate cyclodeaminase
MLHSIRDMDASIWSATLASFCEEVGGSNPAPASVAVSAVAANLGLGLLIKVLKITARRKSFAGDSQKLRALIDAALRESQQLRTAADEDVAAVRQYLSSTNPAAVRNAIEVPIRAARAAVSGIELCGEASGIIYGLLAADLGAAVLLLSASVRAILLSVDFNLRQLRSEEQYSEGVAVERRLLEDRTAGQVAAILLRISEDAQRGQR